MRHETNTQDSDRVDYHPDRRRILEMGGLAAVLSLAGCMGDGAGGDGTPTSGTTTDGDTTDSGTTTDDSTTTGEEGYAHVDGQTFRLPLSEDPTKFSWFINDADLGESQPDGVDINRTENIGALTYEKEVWGQWMVERLSGAEDLHYRLYDNVVTEPNRLEITVSDDAYWSDGTQMTSRDAIANIIGTRLTSNMMSFAQVAEQGPADDLDAVTGFELPDDRTAVLRSEGGHFDEVIKQNLWNNVLMERGPLFPTHITPYKEYVDRLYEVMQQAQAGEIDPWSSPEQYLRPGIQQEIYSGGQNWYEYFKDPANIHTTGAWQVSEVLQNEIVFTPNEYHRYADQVNFDEIIAEQMQDDDVIWTSLSTGRIDYASTTPPAHVVDEFPDTYDRVKVPSTKGSSLVLNHTWPGLHKTAGRQGLFYGIDKTTIAETVNQNLYDPIQVPGGDAPNLDQYISPDWVEQNLIDYTYNPERGAEKMREAGFTKPNDVWLDENGDPIQLIVHVEGQSGALTLATALAGQLRQFGVQCEVRPLEPTQFENAKPSGDLCMFPFTFGAGAPGWVAQTYRAGWMWEGDAYASRIWPKETLDQIEYEAYAQNRAPEDVKHLTLMAPPVGQPDGELQEYRPIYLMRSVQTEPDIQRRLDMMKTLYWLMNWHMPTWPIANTHTYTFLNTGNWMWESKENEDLWNMLGRSWLRFPDMLSWGDQVFANPENPKPE